MEEMKRELQGLLATDKDLQGEAWLHTEDLPGCTITWLEVRYRYDGAYVFRKVGGHQDYARRYFAEIRDELAEFIRTKGASRKVEGGALLGVGVADRRLDGDGTSHYRRY